MFLWLPFLFPLSVSLSCSLSRPSRSLPPPPPSLSLFPSLSFSLSFPHSSLHSLRLAIGSDKTCNGVPGLCDLRFNEVTFPATHKSGAYGLTNDDYGEVQPYKQIRQNLATSQTLTFREQLEAGIRAVDIEPCCSKGENERTVSYTQTMKEGSCILKSFFGYGHCSQSPPPTLPVSLSLCCRLNMAAW